MRKIIRLKRGLHFPVLSLSPPPSATLFNFLLLLFMTHMDYKLLRSRDCSFVIYTSNEIYDIMTSPRMINRARKRKELKILILSNVIFTSI